MDKPILRVASFSGGKDSTAMLLRMLELGEKPDIILFCDTTLEFPQMYDHIAKVERDTGMPITRIQCKDSYEYLMFDKPIKRKADSKLAKQYGLQRTGYGWAGPKLRWCTEKLKNRPREQFLAPLREKYQVMEYIGLAADEQYRLKRSCNQDPNHVHPLVDWSWTEAECLQYCYDRGYDWDGLYEHFSRVSCWCCPLQSLQELRQLHKHFPDLWAKLKDWDKRTWRNFRADYSVEELEVRFAFEEECQETGRSITDRKFYTDLKKRLKEVPPR